MYSACSYERSEVESRYDTKTTQENLYKELLKLIRENTLKFCWAHRFLYLLNYSNNLIVFYYATLYFKVLLVKFDCTKNV